MLADHVKCVPKRIFEVPEFFFYAMPGNAIVRRNQ